MLEHQHCQYRTDRIDHDAFPFHNRPDLSGRADVPQQWHHDGRAGDHQNGAQQCRESCIKTEEESGGYRPQDPGYQGTDADQPKDRASRTLQFRELQRQPPLKQNRCNGERDDGKEDLGANQLVARARQFCQHLVRAHEQSQCHAKSQEQQDRRQSQTPGEPLRQDT